MAFPQGAKDILGRLTGEPAKPAVPPPKAAAEPLAPRPVANEATAANSLKSRLSAAVQGRSVIAAGTFHLVGLAEIREHLGPEWERVRDKVHKQTQRVIERHI